MVHKTLEHTDLPKVLKSSQIVLKSSQIQPASSSLLEDLVLGQLLPEDVHLDPLLGQDDVCGLHLPLEAAVLLLQEGRSQGDLVLLQPPSLS